MPKVTVNIRPELLNERQVYEFFGGNVSLEQVRSMMKSGAIKSTLLQGKVTKYVTTREVLEQFSQTIFETPIGNIFFPIHGVINANTRKKADRPPVPNHGGFPRLRG